MLNYQRVDVEEEFRADVSPCILQQKGLKQHDVSVGNCN
jgi:hypothetical protein